MNVYEIGCLKEKLSTNTYPGRGIVLGVTADGKKSVAAYFIMGRSVNSRNRVFVQESDGIRTEAHAIFFIGFQSPYLPRSFVC